MVRAKPQPIGDFAKRRSSPLAAELALTEIPERLVVSVRSDSGDGAIQCRVYAEGVLVAIGTGTGSVDCVARRAP